MMQTFLFLGYCANFLIGLGYFFFGDVDKATFFIAMAILVRLSIAL